MERVNCRICEKKRKNECSNTAIFGNICKECLNKYHSSLLIAISDALKRRINEIKFENELNSKGTTEL